MARQVKALALSLTTSAARPEPTREAENTLSNGVLRPPCTHTHTHTHT